MKEGFIHHAWVGLGSNLGDRSVQLAQAQEQLMLSCGKILQVSGIYESHPQGFESGHLFFNQCLQLETQLSPLAFLRELLEIERKMGRYREGMGYTDRIIDLDILFFDDLIIHSEDLHVPHPRMADRKFVLYPLWEIAADKMDPETGLTVAELLAQCNDPSHIERVLS